MRVKVKLGGVVELTDAWGRKVSFDLDEIDPLVDQLLHHQQLATSDLRPLHGIPSILPETVPSDPDVYYTPDVYSIVRQGMHEEGVDDNEDLWADVAGKGEN